MFEALVHTQHKPPMASADARAMYVKLWTRLKRASLDTDEFMSAWNGVIALEGAFEFSPDDFRKMRKRVSLRVVRA